MVDNELLEKKLTFERIYNYGGKVTIQDYLLSNPELPEFLIETYKKILDEYREGHNEYYAAVQNKLMSVDDFVENGN